MASVCMCDTVMASVRVCDTVMASIHVYVLLCCHLSPEETVLLL